MPNSFNKNIFINCPFDNDYINDLLKPMLFIIIRNGFTPQIALENSDSGQSRLVKITKLMKQSKYSIHDISIIKSKKKNEYARMNMPFELGIDYGLRNSGISQFKNKQFLILGNKEHDHLPAISDINGLDIMCHNNQTITLITQLRHWFSTTVKIKHQAAPIKLTEDYFEFNKILFERMLTKYGGNEMHAKNAIETFTIPEFINQIKSPKSI